MRTLFFLINTMSYNTYGVTKFGDNFYRLKHAGTIDDDLNMNGKKIVGLPTHIGNLSREGDTVSHRISLGIMARLNGTDRMTDDLLINSSNNDSVHGMHRFRYNRETFRSIFGKC